MKNMFYVIYSSPEHLKCTHCKVLLRLCRGNNIKQAWFARWQEYTFPGSEDKNKWKVGNHTHENVRVHILGGRIPVHKKMTDRQRDRQNFLSHCSIIKCTHLSYSTHVLQTSWSQWYFNNRQEIQPINNAIFSGLLQYTTQFRRSEKWKQALI
jgi:hypothetical protein